MTRHTTRHAALAAASAALLTAGLLAGCGNADQTQRPDIDSGVQHQLRRDVAAVASAVASHSTPAAQAALAALDADLAAAHTAGKLTDARLAQIRTAATRLLTSLTGHATSVAPTPSPASRTVTTLPGHGTRGKPSGKPHKTGKGPSKPGHGPKGDKNTN